MSEKTSNGGMDWQGFERCCGTCKNYDANSSRRCVLNGEIRCDSEGSRCDWWRGKLFREPLTAPAASRGSILDEAKAIINGERQDQYGSPEDSFKLIASYWEVYVDSVCRAANERNAKLGNASTFEAPAITAKDVAAMMVLSKLARQAHQHKRDNIVDAAGYLGILGDMEEKK